MSKGYTLKKLAEITQATPVGNLDVRILGVASLEEATLSDVSFLANQRYVDAMVSSKAGVICIDKHALQSEGKNYLVSQDPSATFQQIAHLFFPKSESSFTGKIHPTAVIHPSANIGKEVTVGPYVVIDQGVSIGDHTVIHPSVTIGPNVSVGQNCLLYPQVVIREGCILNNRVIVQPGAVIGSCGFGYITNEKGHHNKLDQLGIVVLEDDVEIGANTTIDRARFKETRICRGTKIDNLVQIGHNVQLGEDNIIISQSGIAGSTTTGKHVYFAGQVGAVGHIKITDNVMIASKSGISKSIEKSGKYSGIPVLPLRKHNEVQVHLRNISSYIKKLRELEKTVKELTDQLSSTR